jgi:hypothetical protein
VDSIIVAVAEQIGSAIWPLLPFGGKKLMRILILEINHKVGGILGFSTPLCCPKFSYHVITFLYAPFQRFSNTSHSSLLLQLV